MNKELEHYKWMRRVMGISVILLPILPILAGLIGSYNPPNWWNSISATYHTNANGVMVSLLAISAFFFCTYPGYDWRDRVVNFLSGLSLFIIILFLFRTFLFTKWITANRISAWGYNFLIFS